MSVGGGLGARDCLLAKNTKFHISVDMSLKLSCAGAVDLTLTW